uniref:Uncharacterized protein n=1 Tax=Rhizophora mucronata TaxID=61149 RepID=A0A2P2QMF4_RHIMU
MSFSGLVYFENGIMISCYVSAKLFVLLSTPMKHAEILIFT